MAGRKKNWNPNTVSRYHGKVLRVSKGIIPDEELAKRIAETQTDSWEEGSSLFRKIRAIAKEVMDDPATYVNPAFRVPYYAYIQKYVKDVMILRMPEQVVRQYLNEKFKGVDENIINAIISRIKGEALGEEVKAQQRS